MNHDNNTISATVNNETIKSINASTDGYHVNGQFYPWDLSFLPDGRIHIIKDQRNYIVQVLERDVKNKSFSLKINNNYFYVKLSDPFDRLLEKMGMSEGAGFLDEKLQAPMPGQIVEILIEEGTMVSQGDPLVVLKAMKMENILKATSRTTVKKILIREGDAVEKNQDLILF
jgi:acetyl/propionyl-CoA carboxylase alpha subunit